MARLVKVLIAGIRTADAPVASGLAYAYNPGTTTLGNFMYTAPDLVTLTANPVVLDAEGRAEVYCSDTANFRLVVKNAAATSTYIDVDPAESDTAALTSAITVDTTNDDALSAGAGSLLRAWMQFIWEGLSNQSTASTAADMRYLHHQAVNGTASVGAVGRYPYQIWSDHWNVRDFNAVGDGVSDDTVAVQAAIAACALRGGGAVYFPGGIYLCSALTMVNLDNVTLVGDGPGSIIRQSSTTSTLLAISGTSDSVEIHSLQFQGGGNTGTTTALGISCASGIPATARPPVNIHDCVFSGSADGTGFNVAIEALGTRGLVNNCYFQRIYGANSCAVRVNTGDSWSISNCHILGADGAGTRCVHGVANTTTGAGRRTRVTGCHIEGTSGAGVRFIATGGGDVVTGNYFYSCQGAGVRLTSTNSCTVSGNTMDTCQDGVLVDEDGATSAAASIGWAITGNVMVSCTRNGVRAINATDSASYTPRLGNISGNTIRSNAQSGIVLAGTDNVLVSGNLVAYCTTDASYPGILVQSSLPVATHRGGFNNIIIGNHITDAAGVTWTYAIQIQGSGGGIVTNVDTTRVIANSLSTPVGKTPYIAYGVTTSSPLGYSNTAWDSAATAGTSATAYGGLLRPWYDMASTGTVPIGYNGGTISNRGAAGSVTATLPVLGAVHYSDNWEFTFIRQAGQNFVIAAGAGATIIRSNTTAGSITLTATTDQILIVRSVGANWYALITDVT